MVVATFTRLVGSALLVAAVAGAAAGAQPEPRPQGTNPRPGRTASGPSIRFDLPDGYDRRRPDGSYVIAGFDVGYFDGNAVRPLWSFFVLTEDVRVVSPGTGEITLQRRR